MTEDNPASALYSILYAVRQSGADNVGNGWKAALGSAIDSGDFPRRHAEVVHLFSKVHQHLLSLPEDDEDRELYLKYAPSWYRAIVFRDSWGNSQKPAASIIDEQTLDQLRGLGRILHRTSGDTLTSEAVDQLRKGLKQWRELLDESGIPSNVAERIKSQVDLIEWLLENVSTYGAEPVVRESRNLVGLGVEVLQQVPGKAKKVAVALAYVAYFLGIVHQGVDQAAGVLEGLNEARTQYEQLFENAPAIEHAESVGEIESEESKVIDAEVVDDGADNG